VNDDKWGLMNEPIVDWHELIHVNQSDEASRFVAKIKEMLESKNVDKNEGQNKGLLREVLGEGLCDRDNEKSLIDAYTGELPIELVPSFELPKINWKDFIEEDRNQDELGYFPLRKSIDKLVENEYGFATSIDQIMITSGGHQALFLIVQTLLESGDAVAICSPSFLYSLNLFQTSGIRLFGVPMDSEGMRIDCLENEILKHRVKLVMINPTFQNPTGISMSLQRRKDLIQLCQTYKVPIIEDDAFGFLPFDSNERRLPPLKMLDPNNVIYIGSLSKIIGSTTKIGWISALPAVLKKLSTARSDLDLTLSIFPQVLAKFALADNSFDEKIKNLRKQIAGRMRYFFNKSDQELIDIFEYTKPKGGFYVWLEVKEAYRDRFSQKKLEQLVDEGVLFLPSFIFGEKKMAIRVNIARLGYGEVDRLVEKLGFCIIA
jgi:DNA-binding transcriptional MocR family regulator